MKVFHINTFGNLSTGRIASDIVRSLYDNGHEGLLAFARNQTDADISHYVIGTKKTMYLDGVLTRLTDRAGFYSKSSTKKLINTIKEYNPDIIHLHNLHGYYLNIEILCNYLRESMRPVVWTLHDCWAFTGHCCHYSLANCVKWKTSCLQCPQKKEYPKSVLFDNSKRNFQKKKELFLSLSKLHFVCVSKWLEKEVEQSFLNNLPHEVIYNGVDLELFRPTKSCFRKKYGLEAEKIILGVASSWNEKKGLQDFIQLSQLIDNQYKIVLVGLSEKEKTGLPSNIIGLGRTKTTEELVEIYNAADVYINASVEETFGLTTVEALACGTPVIVYDATALPEVVDGTSGFVVKPHNLQEVINQLDRVQDTSRAAIAREASKYDKKKTMVKYLDLYKRLLFISDAI